MLKRVKTLVFMTFKSFTEKLEKYLISLRHGIILTSIQKIIIITRPSKTTFKAVW